MLLSNLIEYYIESERANRPFSRGECMYFSQFAAEMLEAGQDSEALREAAAGFDMTESERAKICLEAVLRENFGITEINEEAAFNAAVDEYKRGEFENASEFLYYKDNIAKKLKFPYTIDYNGVYFAKENKELCDTDLEDFACDFLAKNGIERE